MSYKKLLCAVGLAGSACVFAGLASASPAFSFIDRVPSVQQVLALKHLQLPTHGLPTRRINDAGLQLVKRSEGWVPRLYNDSAGYCTVGYGHLVHLSRCNGVASSERPFLHGLKEPPQGTDLLLGDLSGAEIAVSKYVTVPLDDNQFAALTDFVFNVGSRSFGQSTLLRVINGHQGNQVIAAQFRRWVYANGKLYQGLVLRRDAEIHLFVGATHGLLSLPPVPNRAQGIDVLTGMPPVPGKSN